MARCRLSTLRCIAQLHSIKPITQYGGGTDIICSLSALLATGRWLELSAAWSGQFLIMVQVCWRGTNSPPALFMSVEKTCIVEWKIFNNISREKSLFEDLSFFSNSYFYMFFKFAFGCIKLSFVGSPPPLPFWCICAWQSHRLKKHPPIFYRICPVMFFSSCVSSGRWVRSYKSPGHHRPGTTWVWFPCALERARERETERWGEGSWNLEAPDNNVLLHLYWFSWLN